jgi:hypothetical protein
MIQELDSFKSEADAELEKVFKIASEDDPSWIPYYNDFVKNGFTYFKGEKIFLNGIGKRSQSFTKYLSPEGVIKVKDPYKRTFKPNPVYKFPLSKMPFGEKDWCDEIKFEDRPYDEQQASVFIRNKITDSNYLNRFSKKFTVLSIPSYSDGIAFPTMLGNTVGVDYITQCTTEALEFKRWFYDTTTSLPGTTEDEKEQLSIIKTLYNYRVPRTVSVSRTEARKLPPDLQIPREALEHFSKIIDRFFIKNFSEIQKEENYKKTLPKIKGTKSPGPFPTWPDGSPYLRDDYVVPDDWAKGETPEFLAVANNIAFKLEWINSEKLVDNLKWFLNNRRKIGECNPEVLSEAIERHAIHMVSPLVRGNNGDKVKDGKTKPRKFEALLGSKVLRAVTNPDKVKKMTREQWRKDHPSVPYPEDFATLKGRFAYNANNAEFGVSFIHFIKVCLGDIEQSPNGFPSMNPEVQRSYEQFFSENKDNLYYHGDAANSEQYISTAWEWAKYLFPDYIRELIDALLVCFRSSESGPQIVKAMLSGIDITTFLNMFIVGFLTFVNFITRAEFGMKPKVEDFISIGEPYLDAWFSGKASAFLNNGAIVVNPKTMTDDAVIVLKRHTFKFYKEVKQKFDEFGLGYAISELPEGNPFGLRYFSNLPPMPKSAIGEPRAFPDAGEVDKIHSGDVIMFRFIKHVMAMRPEIRNSFIREFKARGFGDWESYPIYIAAFFYYQKMRHYTVPFVAETESFTSKLVFSGKLTEDLAFGEQKYPKDSFISITNIFIDYINSFGKEIPKIRSDHER